MISRRFHFVAAALLFTGGLVAENRPPYGWKVIQDGKGGEFTEVKDASYLGPCKCTMKVNVGGMLGLRKDVEDDCVLVRGLVTALPTTEGSACGYYVCLSETILLKLTVVKTAGGHAIQFSATQGNKNWGKKQIPWNDKIAYLTLKRTKDTFSAEAAGSAGSGGPKTLASIKWPNLPRKCYAGALATHFPKTGNPESFTLTLTLRNLDTELSRAENSLSGIGMANPESALKRLSGAMANWGEHVKIHLMLADAYEALNQFDKVEESYRQALRMEPDNVSALNRCAWDFVERGVKLEEAVVMAKKAKSLAPDKAYILDTLGMAYLKQGKKADARTQLEQSCALLKKEKEVQSNHFSMFEHLGDTYLALGETEAEKKLYLDVIERTKKTIAGMKYTNALLVAGLGRMYTKLGQLKEAQKEYERAVKEFEKFTQYQSWFSQIHERLGDVYLQLKSGDNDLYYEKEAAESYLNAFYNFGRFHDGDGERRVADKIKKILNERPEHRKKIGPIKEIGG